MTGVFGRIASAAGPYDQIHESRDEVIDEPLGRHLGDGRRFAFDFNSVEVVFFSFIL